MECVPRVLIPLDLSVTSRLTVVLAGAIAPKAACATVFHVNPLTEGLPPLDRRSRSALAQTLELLGKPLENGERTIEVAIGEGDPGAEIVARAERCGTDLIVMGAQPRRVFDRLGLGPVSEYVASRSGCSILAVRHACLVPDLSTLLCAVDLDSPSPEALDRAVEIARQVRAHLVILNVVGDGVARDGQASRQLIALSTHERLARLVSRHTSFGVSVDLLVTFGRARDEILRVARQCGAGLVVVGAPVGERNERSLSGTTARRVLAENPSPVLMSRPLPAPPSVAAGAEWASRELVRA